MQLYSLDVPMHSMGTTPLVRITQSYRKSVARSNVSAKTHQWADHNRHSTETDTEEKQLNYKVGKSVLLYLVGTGLHHLAVSLMNEI